MSQNRGLWVAAISILVVVLLGWRWLATNPTLGSIMHDTATTTASTRSPKNYTVTRSAGDVVSIAEGLEGASRFASLLRSTGVASSIKSSGEYTIFVPADGAFSQLPNGTISGMTSTQLKRLVQYHVVAGRAIDASAETAGSIAAMSGDMLNFSYTTTNIPMVNSSIIASEYRGKNGIVYLINRVLLPPQKVAQ